MGLLLSILFSYVGAVELMFVIRDIVHQVGLHRDDLLEIGRSTSMVKITSLRELQENIRKSIKSAHEQLVETDGIQCMADGVQYEQGYRVSTTKEDDLSKQWFQARANATIVEPTPTQSPSNVAISYVTATVPTNDNNNIDSLRNQIDGHRRSSSSISAETVVENRQLDNLIDADDLSNENYPNQSNDEIPDIHFDEYSSDYSHALDGIRNQGQAKYDEMSRRRKNYKGFSNDQTNESLERRRSEDIDAGVVKNPWGELNPENFHDASLWQRERAMSIAENDEIMAFVDEEQYEKDFKRKTKQLNTTLSIDNNHYIHDENQNVREPFLFSDLYKYLFLCA